jgi:hypothetical protein
MIAQNGPCSELRKQIAELEIECAKCSPNGIVCNPCEELNGLRAKLDNCLRKNSENKTSNLKQPASLKQPATSGNSQAPNLKDQDGQPIRTNNSSRGVQPTHNASERSINTFNPLPVSDEAFRRMVESRRQMDENRRERIRAAQKREIESRGKMYDATTGRVIEGSRDVTSIIINHNESTYYKLKEGNTAQRIQERNSSIPTMQKKEVNSELLQFMQKQENGNNREEVVTIEDSQYQSDTQTEKTSPTVTQKNILRTSTPIWETDNYSRSSIVHILPTVDNQNNQQQIVTENENNGNNINNENIVGQEVIVTEDREYIDNNNPSNSNYNNTYQSVESNSQMNTRSEDGISFVPLKGNLKVNIAEDFTNNSNAKAIINNTLSGDVFYHIEGEKGSVTYSDGKSINIDENKVEMNLNSQGELFIVEGSNNTIEYFNNKDQAESKCKELRNEEYRKIIKGNLSKHGNTSISGTDNIEEEIKKLIEAEKHIQPHHVPIIEYKVKTITPVKKVKVVSPHSIQNSQGFPPIIPNHSTPQNESKNKGGSNDDGSGKWQEEED